jgi:putative transposase
LLHARNAVWNALIAEDVATLARQIARSPSLAAEALRRASPQSSESATEALLNAHDLVWTALTPQDGHRLAIAGAGLLPNFPSYDAAARVLIGAHPRAWKASSAETQESIKRATLIKPPALLRLLCDSHLMRRTEPDRLAGVIEHLTDDDIDASGALAAVALFAPSSFLEHPAACSAVMHRIARDDDVRDAVRNAIATRMQRAGVISRKQKGSRNRATAKTKLARLHARIANIRQDALHTLTTNLTRRVHAIVIEDLNVRGMVGNRHLARSIADMGFYEFRRQLECKAAMRGGAAAAVDRRLPSSKTCSACGTVQKKMPPAIRQWTCPDCGTLHDRDGNAVSSAVSACGEEGSGLGRKRKTKPASVKQEVSFVPV